MDWNWTLSTKRIMSCWGLAYFQTTGSNSCSLHTFLMHKNKFSYRWMTGVNGQKHVVSYKTDVINNNFCKNYTFLCNFEEIYKCFLYCRRICFSFSYLRTFILVFLPILYKLLQSIKSELSLKVNEFAGKWFLARGECLCFVENNFVTNCLMF